MKRTSQLQIAKTKVPFGNGLGPAEGPWKLGILDALWCSLTLILGAFYKTNL